MYAVDTRYTNVAAQSAPPQGRYKDASLQALLQQYIDIENTLEGYAELIPEGADQFVQNELKQFALLDEQARLLEKVFTMPIVTLEDAKVKMILWERVVIQGKSAQDVSSADSLAKSVFDFFKTM